MCYMLTAFESELGVRKYKMIDGKILNVLLQMSADI